MELEYFIEPNDKEANKWFDYWKDLRLKWYVDLGIKSENLRFREHRPGERAHYAKKAVDIEYNSPFGWSEFEGIHNRGNFDLSRHKLSYKDSESGKSYVPWVIETSGGVDRSTLFFLIDSYVNDGKREFLKIHPKLAPIKVAVFPLLANKPELIKMAKKIYKDLKKNYMVSWDDRGNIGKRYAYQDEIGTPICITVDFESLENNTVTLRNRDTTKQIRVHIKDLVKNINEILD
jgi:glycyl-tRNA synthetase